MNRNLEHIIRIYSTKEHKIFTNTLLELSKDDLISVFSSLLTMYINDKNSSTIREFITVTLAGYTHNSKKIGFNGFKQSSIGEPINCEAKPQNFSIQDYDNFKKGKRRTSPSKLNGGGSFNDYTWARFRKDRKTSFNMLLSGFVDGQLIFLLEVPFNSTGLIKKLELQLKRILPNGDEKNHYVRGANFSFSDYQDSTKLKPIFIISKQKLKYYKKCINKTLYSYLIKEAKK